MEFHSMTYYDSTHSNTPPNRSGDVTVGGDGVDDDSS